MKRILIATFFGLVAGVICASGAFLGHVFAFSYAALAFTLLNRAIMGFVIGISGLKLRWGWNGFFLGIIVGSIFSYYLHMKVGPSYLPLINLFVNGLFGLMIEFFTTVVFREPAFALAGSRS